MPGALPRAVAPSSSADVVSCSHPSVGARGGETLSMAPGLVPLPRHLRQTSSPARIPDWEREEGRLPPWRPASGRCPVIFGGRRLLLASLTGSERRGDSYRGPDTMTCSFHKLLQVEEIAVSAWHLLQRPTH